MTALNIQLLGAWQVTRADGAIADLKYDKVRALLAYLAVESASAHRREKLAALLWPDLPPDASRNNLRQALHTLRQAIDDHDAHPPYLVTTRTTVQFDEQSNARLDVAQFANALAFVRRHAHRNPHSCQTCAARLEDAVALFRGPFLSGLSLPDSVPFEEWALLQREHYNRLMLDALQHLLTVHRRRGDYQRAIGYARHQIELEPWREQAHRALMRLYLLLDRRDAALAQYEACRLLLREELDVKPEDRTTRLYEQIRDADESHELPPALTPASDAPPFHVPLPPTPFIGRHNELDEIARLLDDASSRLITITGPGGVGKTRLALQAAADQANLFSGGIYFINLSAIEDVAQLPELIAASLSLDPEPQAAVLDMQSLARSLAHRELLLILDNFDHLVEDAVILEPILRHAPRINLLITSRQRLKLQAEWAYPLSGFDTPDPGESPSPASPSGDDALKLFLSGARRAGNELPQTSATVSQIAHICRLLDGLPLGIELAAAWTSTLSLGEIAAEIERGVRFLTARQRDMPPRHHSLWGVMAQSWQRLRPQEQDALAQLSVFDGPFSRPAAHAVAGATLPVLAALVDNSLLQRHPPRRYALHPLLRQYATQQLQPARAAHTVHARLLDYYLRQAEAAAVEPDDSAQSHAMQRLAAEYENVRAALGWARRNALSEKGLRLATALYRFWYWRSHFREGSAWLSAFLDAGEVGDSLPTDAALPASLLADAYYANGVLLSQQDRHAEALRSLQCSLALRRRLDDHAGQAACLNSLGIIAWRRQSFSEATAYLEESLALRRQLGDANLGPPLNNLGLVALAQGQFRRAESHFLELLRRAREHGQEMGVAISLGNLALAVLEQGRLDEARAHLAAGATLFHKFKDREGLAGCLETAAALAIALDDPTRAAALCAAAAALRQEIHVPLTPVERSRYEETLAVARSSLHPDAFTTAWDRGAHLSLDQALALISDL